MLCVGVLQREYSGDGCDLASTSCKYDFRKGDLFVLSCATSEVRKYNANVWWRSAQYFVLASCG